MGRFVSATDQAAQDHVTKFYRYCGNQQKSANINKSSHGTKQGTLAMAVVWLFGAAARSRVVPG